MSFISIFSKTAKIWVWKPSPEIVKAYTRLAILSSLDAYLGCDGKRATEINRSRMENYVMLVTEGMRPPGKLPSGFNDVLQELIDEGALIESVYIPLNRRNMSITNENRYKIYSKPNDGKYDICLQDARREVIRLHEDVMHKTLSM